MMQDIWKRKIDWDDCIPPDIYTAWTEFATQLNLINELSIDRLGLIPDHTDSEIHGFCDASNTGYGACIYIRSIDHHNNVRSQLLCAKSKVALLKTTTIPRLELCGALLLAKLYREVCNAVEFSINRTIMWTDSTIVLHWVNTAPYLLNTYVSNRVAQIQEITDPKTWRHIRSQNNPADALSKGQTPNVFLNNPTWFSGPSWLTDKETEWPKEIIKLNKIPELRKTAYLTLTSNDHSILHRYSSYPKLLRVIAWCLRFRRKNAYRGQCLEAKEIDEAELRIIKIVQSSCFSRESKELSNKRSVSKINIAALNPFIDESGLICVGGRLKESKLTFS